MTRHMTQQPGNPSNNPANDPAIISTRINRHGCRVYPRVVTRHAGDDPTQAGAHPPWVSAWLTRTRPDP
jgi:hypothetical protein